MGKVMGYDFIVWPEMQARKGMVKAAQSRGMKLSQWVIEALDEAEKTA
jgi:predicted HicB family RNase H-like nuclease